MPPKAAAHPKYEEMVKAAILALKDRNGSSVPAIAKYLAANYKLPDNFKKILSTQLKNLVKSGKLLKVKASYKLGEALKKAPKKPKKKAAPKKKKAAKKPKKKAVKKPKKAAKKAAQDWANGVQTVDQAGAEIEVDDKDIVGTTEKEPPFRPGQAIKDTVYVALYNHIIKVRDSIDLGTPTGLDAAMRVDQAYLGVFRFYRALQYLQNFLKKAKTANALDDGQAGRIIKMMPILKRFKPLNEAMIDQDAKERAKVNQSPLSVGPGESYKVKLARLVDDMIFSIQKGMLRYPPHKGSAEVALDRARKILSDTRKGKAGVKDPKDPGYSPADTEIQQGSINVKQLVGPQLKAADLFDPAKDKQDMRVAKSQAARLKTQGKDKEARTVMAKAKQKAGGAVLQRDITKVIRRFLNKQMQRIGADMSIVAENRELFEAALLEEFKSRGLIK